MLTRAKTVEADVVMLDLEDSVPPDEKVEARGQVIDAACDRGWSARGLSLRVNGLDTEWCYSDIIEVVEGAGDAIDLITVPKVESAGDVHFVATLLEQIEQHMNLQRMIGITILIETPLGMAHVNEIASACPERAEAMVFGVADYAASMQFATTSIGGFEDRYAVLAGDARDPGRSVHYGDHLHYGLSRMAVACRAYGLRPIDGPYGDVDDAEGYLASARRASVVGYEGKWAIHPSQVSLANDVFTPPEALTRQSERIVAAMEEAAEQGRGAVSLDGVMVDAASVRMAEGVMQKAGRIEADKLRSSPGT
jgi:malyl-CoA/(S)-citramalyl-CoA lyase